MNIGTTFKIILPKIGEDTEQCSIFNINNYNTELELSYKILQKEIIFYSVKI